MRLAGKVAVVTGASSGIGRATAELFAEHGATVYATDVVPPAEGGQATFVKQDVADDGAWADLVARVRAEQGKLDVLVNNAGIVGAYDTITEIDMATYHRVIAVNQTGAFLGMRHCIPLMLDGVGSSVVNVSSIWGLIGARGVAAYQASKGALTCLTKNAALSYAPRIRCNSVHPGLIRTNITAEQDPAMNQVLIDQTPLQRMAEPREVAFAILFLAGDESSFVTGSELVVDGGYTIQ